MKINNTCTPCAHYCATCSKNVNQCDSCVAGVANYRKDINGNCQCLDGYYNNGNNIVCEKCPYQCQTCGISNNAIKCLTCSDVSHRTLDKDICNCNDGYYDNGNNEVCSQCPSNCQQCSLNLQSIIQCNQCSNGYFLNSSNQCEKCSDLCQTCLASATTCTSCFPSQNRKVSGGLCICNTYYEEYTPQQLDCKQQDICNKTCETCLEFLKEDKCQTCPIGRDLIIEGNQRFCKCKPGFYSDSNFICQKCNDLCKTCNGQSNTNCLSCFEIEQFRTLDSTTNTCICKDGYYLSNGLCQLCSQNCKTCSDGGSNICKSCFEGQNKILQNNECVCKEGYFLVNNVCQECNSTCKTCNGNGFNNCTSCKESQNRNLKDNQCICNEGFAQVNGICQACDTTCKTCFDIGKDKCLSCFDNQNRYFSNNQCQCLEKYVEVLGNLSCQSCFPNCQTCNNQNPQQCLSCLPNQNRELNKQTGECQCQDGYYSTQSNEKCSKCNDLCLKCSNSASYCTACKSPLRILSKTNQCICQLNYYEDSLTKDCKKCPQGCSVCENQEKCQKCEQNYVINSKGYCEKTIPSSTPKETIKALQSTTKESTTVVIGATMTSSVLLSSIQPNSSIASQFLFLQKLNLMLLFNFAYPELLFSFFKAFGGDSPIDSVRDFNYLNKFLIKDDYGNLLPNKFEAEEIGESVIYNCGGCITILFMVWLVSIPPIILYKKNKQIQELVELKNKFLIVIKFFNEKIFPFGIILAHQILSIIMFLSIALQFYSIFYIPVYKYKLFSAKIAVSCLTLAYLSFVLYKFYSIVNKQQNYQNSIFFLSKEQIEFNIYAEINSCAKCESYLTRNFKFFYILIENVLFPLLITFLEFDFKLQLGACLSIQFILLSLSIFTLPMKSKLENTFLIIEQFCWVLILSCLFVIGMKIQGLSGIKDIPKNDIHFLTILSWIIISTCLIIFIQNPIQLILQIVLNIKSITAKLQYLYNITFRKLCKSKLKDDSIIVKPSLFDFNLQNSSSQWSKQIISQKSIIQMYPQMRSNPHQQSMLSINNNNPKSLVLSPRIQKQSTTKINKQQKISIKKNKSQVTSELQKEFLQSL